MMSDAIKNLKWKYFRDSKLKVSKWIPGNNWVTKWDNRRFCIIRILGMKSKNINEPDPKAARIYVEQVVDFPNESA